MASENRAADAIRPLVNAKDLQLLCARILHETLLVPVLMYGSDTMLWRGLTHGHFMAREAPRLRPFSGSPFDFPYLG